MDLYKKIGPKITVIHKKIGQEPFLNRYNEETNQLTLLAHYRHLTQLLTIYKTLEIRMNNLTPDSIFNLPPHLKYLLNQSEFIQKDLNALSPHVIEKSKDDLLPATNNYVANLNEMSEEQAFAHFIVRVLGDHFGGQRMRDRVSRLIREQKITLEINFNHFAHLTESLKQLTTWLNQLAIKPPNETDILNEMVTAFEYHFPIFIAIEKSLDTKTSWCGFFAKGLGATAVTVAATAIVYNTMMAP